MSGPIHTHDLIPGNFRYRSNSVEPQTGFILFTSQNVECLRLNLYLKSYIIQTLRYFWLARMCTTFRSGSSVTVFDATTEISSL